MASFLIDSDLIVQTQIYSIKPLRYVKYNLRFLTATLAGLIAIISMLRFFNTVKPEESDWCLADKIPNAVFVIANSRILIQILPKFCSYDQKISNV